MGFSLEQVVTMATSAPAKIINRLDKLGTLALGAPPTSRSWSSSRAVEFVDTRKKRAKATST